MTQDHPAEAPGRLDDPDPTPEPRVEVPRMPLAAKAAGVVALGLTLWLCVYAFGRAGDRAADNPATDPAIVRQVPSPGSHVLRQSQVGVELREGYDGRITINGTPIPEDQMDGAIDTTAPNYDARYGVRPNNRNQVFFTPGPDKAVTGYRSGEATITVEFWPIAAGESRARRVTWAIFVT